MIIRQLFFGLIILAYISCSNKPVQGYISNLESKKMTSSDGGEEMTFLKGDSFHLKSYKASYEGVKGVYSVNGIEIIFYPNDGQNEIVIENTLRDANTACVSVFDRNFQLYRSIFRITGYKNSSLVIIKDNYDGIESSNCYELVVSEYDSIKVEIPEYQSDQILWSETIIPENGLEYSFLQKVDYGGIFNSYEFQIRDKGIFRKGSELQRRKKHQLWLSIDK